MQKGKKKRGKKKSNFSPLPPSVPHRRLTVNLSKASKSTSTALHSAATEWGYTQSLTPPSPTPPGWQIHVRGGFACCLHQGASGRCWVSEAGFLIVWSPAHGHGGSCLFLRFHTAPLCLIANAASPHRLLSSVCATPLWSMANKYERPTAHTGMAAEKQRLSLGSVWVILMVYLWSLQTVYVVDD